MELPVFAIPQIDMAQFAVPYTSVILPNPFLQFGQSRYPFASELANETVDEMENHLIDAPSPANLHNKKRKRTPASTPLHLAPRSALPANEALKRRKAPNPKKKEIFKGWLKMRQKGRTNPALESEAKTLNPEDLYGHFQDFLPEDLEAFDEQMRFERTCAEDALRKALPRSWLLRRSSYNRHWSGRLVGTPADKGDRADALVANNKEEMPRLDDDEEEEKQRMDEEDLDPDSLLRPSFFAFSYKRDASLLKEGEREIGHLLIVFTRLHGWALAEEDRSKGASGESKIYCHYFFSSFIGLLANTLERVGVLPTRMVSYDVFPPAPRVCDMLMEEEEGEEDD